MNSQNDINWIRSDVALAVHEAQLAEHGGETGIRDLGLLESALVRPRNAVLYADLGVPELGALYAVSIAGTHPFVDGNKRVAAVLLETFLEDNGFELLADDFELFDAMMALAKSEVDEGKFTEWVVQRSRPCN